jgi:hypothetical protein
MDEEIAQLVRVCIDKKAQGSGLRAQAKPFDHLLEDLA